MLAAHVCVAIQIVGAPAAPAEVAALQARCVGILGTEQCRLTANEAPAAIATLDRSCWRATVSVGAGGAAATVVLRAGVGPGAKQTRRDLTFRDRDEIPERWATLGLVVAALVTIEEHSAAAPGTAPDASSVGGTAPRPSAPPAAAPTVAASGDRGAASWLGDPRLDATLSGVAALGALPGAALGARVEASSRWSRLGVLARGAYFPARSRAGVPVTGGTGGGQFRLWSAGLGLCGHARGDRALSLRACAGGDLMSTSATGFGVAETATATALSEAIWGGLGAVLHLGRRITLVAESDALVALQRPPFVIRGAGTVFTPARLGASLGIGLGVAF